MEVGGEVGALLGADALGALGREVVGQPPDPRAQDDGQPDPTEGGREQHVGHLADVAVPDGEQRHRADDQDEARSDPDVRRPPAAAEDGPDRVEPLGLVDPARTLGLVGLSPQQPEAEDGEDERPDHDTVADDRLGGQHQAEAERDQGDRGSGVGEPADPPRSAALARGALETRRLGLEGRLGGEHQPQAGVEQEPDAAQHRTDEEGRAYPHDRHRQVAGQTGCDAPDDRVLGVAHRPAYVAGHLARHVVRGQGGGHDASIVAEQHAPDHEEEPRPTPDSQPWRTSRDQGSPRWCTACRRRTVVP